MNILNHEKKWRRCVSCPLGKVHRQRIIYRGAIPADLMIVGEAAGDIEITFESPFIGPAGEKLNAMLRKVFKGYDPDSGYDDETGYGIVITNSIICPPADTPSSPLRKPKSSEITACNTRLLEFVTIASPRYIIAAGRPAEQACKKMEDQGMDVPYEYAPHPSAILRQAEQGNLDEARFIHVLKTAESYLSDPIVKGL